MDGPAGLLARFQASKAWQAWQRYGNGRGTVLAGGAAYAAFFSLFPALAVGFTIFGLFVRDGSDLQQQVIDAVNDSVGTAVISATPGGDGIVSIDTLVSGNTLTVAGIVGLVGLLFTGLGWLDALREGIRAMFGQPPMEGNVVVSKLRDVGVLVGFGLAILVSSAAGIGVSAAAGALLRVVGLDGSLPGRLLLGALGTLVVLAVDTLIFMLLFRVLSGVPLHSHDLWDAALFGAIALGVLKLLSGFLLNAASSNKFLATAGVLLGLLVWLNLISRVTLVAAAWGATVALERGHLVERTGATETVLADQPADPSPVRGVVYTPVVSPRQADRVSVAAGAVLGAAAFVVARAGGRAVRSINEALDHKTPS